jgi:hypothetical protein
VPTRSDGKGHGLTRRRPHPTRTARALAAVFGTVAAIRRRPALHPIGDAYRGRLVITAAPGRLSEVPLFRQGRRFPAIIRASRAAGLPPSFPDALGLAIRLPGRLARRPALDLLLTSSGPGSLSRRLPVPRRSFLRRHFSSLLPYRVARSVVFLGARPLPDRQQTAHGPALAELRAAIGRGPVRYQLLLASRFGPWEPIGLLELLRPLRRHRRPHFNPWHTTGGIRPAGFINRTRDLVYRASQSRAP